MAKQEQPGGAGDFEWTPIVQEARGFGPADLLPANRAALARARP
jgi:hypothetical protein